MSGAFGSPHHADDAGAADLDKPELAHQADEAVDLGRVAGQLEDEARGRGIDHLGAEHVVEALRLADVFRAKVVDTTTSSFIFELTGDPTKIDSFVALMRELGLVEVGRTGIVGMMRGAEGA